MAGSESDRKSRAGAVLPAIPDKLYFRIGEVARLLVLPAYVLRFWESEFSQLKPGKSGTGQRLYRRADLDTLLAIRRLLYDQGYTIPGARQFLKERAHPPIPEPTAVVPLPEAAAPVSSATALQRLRSELLEIASMLSHPVAGARSSTPAHRGLHLASKKRAAANPPTLFAMSRDPVPDDPAG